MGTPCHYLIWKQLGGDASFQGDASCITWQEVFSRTGQKKQHLWHTWKVMATLKIPRVNCKCGFRELFPRPWVEPVLAIADQFYRCWFWCMLSAAPVWGLVAALPSLYWLSIKRVFFKCDFLPEIITHLSRTLHLLIMHPCLWFVSRHLHFSF